MENISDPRSAQSSRKLLVGNNFWRSSVHRDVASPYFDLGSSYPNFTKRKEGQIAHLLTLTAVLIGCNSAYLSRSDEMRCIRCGKIN